MLPKSKMEFGYVVGKLIICSIWNHCNYFSKEVRKVFIRHRSNVPSIWKINMKMLIEKHVRMFTTTDEFYFQIICQIFCTCVWNKLELVLID